MLFSCVQISSFSLFQYVPQVFRSLRLALILCKVKNIQHIFNVSIPLINSLFPFIYLFIYKIHPDAGGYTIAQFILYHLTRSCKEPIVFI